MPAKMKELVGKEAAIETPPRPLRESMAGMAGSRSKLLLGLELATCGNNNIQSQGTTKHLQLPLHQLQLQLHLLPLQSAFHRLVCKVSIIIFLLNNDLNGIDV